MNQRLINILLIAPFLFVNAQKTDIKVIDVAEPIELRIEKLKLETTNNKIIRVVFEIEYKQSIK